jgi:hypothetical protein
MELIHLFKLENNKWYIKKIIETESLMSEITEQSEWCRLNKPLKIECSFKNGSLLDENYYTKMFMKIHGIENVRGGSYDKIDLCKKQIRLLNAHMEKNKISDCDCVIL